MEGSRLSERDGHYKDSWKPEGFDTKQVFVSPSIHYAGRLPMQRLAGDKTMEGSTLSERDGHYKDSWKPEGFDTKQVFVSPSIHYAGLPAYAKASSFTHRGTNYEAKVALQLYIKPGSYKVSASTVARKNIDKKFSDSEIEWSTDRHGVIIVYGLLVKLDEK
uniref:Uncharacterized protein n=1 Tax=Branchiostoma floridae TaxID=7739 RepID=C3YEP0_BRAFL|eukprot:XP_002605124.1 hypothetical protein BRAFLDRAFT_80941 [Branchiostoma floridae]